MLGIIGSSGLGGLENMAVARLRAVRTPYGKPSGALAFGVIRGRQVVFLARHGPGQAIAPHEINYRANIWALHRQKVQDVVAVASVGGIRAQLGPGALAIPDQIIDYTHGRAATFTRRGNRPVRHVDFTHPYCESLRQRLLKAGAVAGLELAGRATYAATQGPRLETAAEIGRLERDGADIVGMTGMPEAALAREIGLCYATIAVVVNHAAGVASSKDGISIEDMREVSRRAMAGACAIIEQLAADQA